MTIIRRLLDRLTDGLRDPRRVKGRHEMEYWLARKEREPRLDHSHYEYFFTNHFGLAPSDYVDRRVLDIGCGPRGSLEWADRALTRVGLDPLAHQYQALGASEHHMRYVTADSESIPFHNGSFDVVSSFNSLDHVNELERTLAEIARVTKPGGWFLLLVHVAHAPTRCEPLSLDWQLTERFAPFFSVDDERHFERSSDGMYDALRKAIPYDHLDTSDRGGGYVSARMIRI